MHSVPATASCFKANEVKVIVVVVVVVVKPLIEQKTKRREKGARISSKLGGNSHQAGASFSFSKLGANERK